MRVGEVVLAGVDEAGGVYVRAGSACRVVVGVGAVERLGVVGATVRAGTVCPLEGTMSVRCPEVIGVVAAGTLLRGVPAGEGFGVALASRVSGAIAGAGAGPAGALAFVPGLFCSAGR